MLCSFHEYVVEKNLQRPRLRAAVAMDYHAISPILRSKLWQIRTTRYPTRLDIHGLSSLLAANDYPKEPQ